MDAFYASIEQLPVRKFFGVGTVTAEKMHKLGIATGKDLKEWSLEALVRNFGKSGSFFYSGHLKSILEVPVKFGGGTIMIYLLLFF